MKKNRWIGEVPTLVGAAIAAYFGFNGGQYVDVPAPLDAVYTWLAFGLGLANIAVIITTLMLIFRIRTNEKWSRLLATAKAQLAARRSENEIIQANHKRLL